MSNDVKHIDPKVLEQAAVWQAKLTSGDVSDEDRVQHMEWMLDNPAHLNAFEHIAQAVHEASTFEQQARAAYASDFEKVVTQSPNKKSLFAWEWPQIATGLAAVAALLFVVIFPSTPFYETPSETRIYAADNSELRNIKLADGSRVNLLNGSRFSVQMDDNSRNINLIEGRAFFDVVSDKTRPFYVNTGKRQIKVVGTRFEVVRHNDFEHIAVNEGLVAVSHKGNNNNEPNTAILIEPGTKAHYQGNSTTPELTKVIAERVGAWTEGVLVFKSEPLKNVVDEIKRLFPSAIIRIETAQLENKPFSGTLVISNTETMATQLAQLMEISVSIKSNEIVFGPK